VDLGRYYAILSASGKHTPASYSEQTGAAPVEQGFAYNSGGNDEFLTVEQLRTLIREELDSSFNPQ